MKNLKTLCSLAAAAGLLVTTGAASAATLINTYGPSNITASASSNFNNVAATVASKTIDASGLSVTTGGGTHGTSTQQSWMSNITNADATVLAAQWIQWDLGTTFVLDSIRVWNYNDSSRFDSGVRELDIYVSAVANPGDPEVAGPGNGDNWTQIGTNVTLSKAPGLTSYTGVDLETDTGISLPAGAIRYVRFGVNSTHWDGTSPGNGLGEFGAGLSEIQFFEAVPEPSVALLSAFGLILLLRRRRD